MHTQEQKNTFRRVCQTFVTGLHSGKTSVARDFLQSVGLSADAGGAGFSSGQIGHRKMEAELQPLIDIGILTPNGRFFHGKPTYTTFGKGCLLWPLRDAAGDVVNFVAYSFKKLVPEIHFLNTEGLYPGYPSPATTRLYMVPEPLSAATVLQSCLLKDASEAVLSLINGQLLSQHIKVLSSTSLQRITCIGCDTGVTEKIQKEFPDLEVDHIPLPEGKTISSIWVAEGLPGLQRLLQGITSTIPTEIKTTVAVAAEPLPTPTPATPAGLRQVHAQKWVYESEVAEYAIQGEIGMELSSLLVTLKICFPNGAVITGRYDLYNVNDRNTIASEAQDMDVSPHAVESDLMFLLLQLDAIRDERLSSHSTRQERIRPVLSHARILELQAFLQNPCLVDNINQKLGEAGIIGEELTRQAAFVVAASFQHKHPLSAIVQGTSGSGKSYLINTIAQCMPPDAVLSLTRASSMSLFYMDSNDLHRKLILIQDWDGLDSETQFALREFQSAGSITNLRPYKDRKTGDIQSKNTEIRASFATLAATTGNVYYDNYSRSIVFGVEESEAQTRAIVERQNRLRAGLVNVQDEEAAKAFLRDMQGLLQTYPVLIPFAHQLQIPATGLALRRLNEQFLNFLEQITLLHQYQREQDEQGRLIATPEDARIAIELFAGSIFIKSDDLDTGLRTFFEQLKRHIKTHIPNGRFRQRDIRHALKYSKSHTQYFLQGLREREYIRITGGTANKGFVYEIDYWDDAAKERERIRETLLAQLHTITETSSPTLPPATTSWQQPKIHP